MSSSTKTGQKLRKRFKKELPFHLMLFDMLPSYRTMKYKSPIWGYFHVQKE